MKKESSKQAQKQALRKTDVSGWCGKLNENVKTTSSLKNRNGILSSRRKRVEEI